MKSAFRQEKAADLISSEAARRRFHPSFPGFHRAKHDFISISPQSQNCRQIWTTTLRPLPKTRTILKWCFYSLDRFELPHQFGSASNSKYEKLISPNGQIRTTENQILTYWRQRRGIRRKSGLWVWNVPNQTSNIDLHFWVSNLQFSLSAFRENGSKTPKSLENQAFCTVWCKNVISDKW